MGNIIHLKEISNRTGLALSTITTYMCNYKFNKFYFKRNQFVLSVEFLETLINFLFSRTQIHYKAIKRVERWLEEVVNE